MTHPPMDEYEVLVRDDCLWWRRPGGNAETLLCLGPVADKDAIYTAMCDRLAADDFGEALTTKLAVGDQVSKPRGYAFDGTVVSVFRNLAGEVRIAAELTTANGKGMLHIFNEDQLERRA